MENRDRDKLSKNTGSTPSGDVNRSTSSNIGKSKSGSSAGFGQNVGRGEGIRGDQGRSSGSSGSSGMQGDSGRSSGSSGLGTSSSGRSGSSSLGDVDRSDMGSKKSNRGGSSNESL
jgi:hypothetical protein